MTALPKKARQDLAKILGLIGSTFEGERNAAIQAATRILDHHGVKWHEILSLPPEPRREPLHATWRQTCAELARRPGDLRPWEKRFVNDLPNFPRISTKQRYVLSEIAARVFGEDPT